MLYLMLPLTPGPEVLGCMPPQIDLPEVLVLDNLHRVSYRKTQLLSITLGI